MKALVNIIMFFMLLSCDILETRDPEDPTAPRSDFITPTQPSILFLNMKNSFKEKVVENYIQCFVDESFLSDDYEFIPSAGSIAQFTVLSDWSKEAERQYFNNIKSQTRQESQIVLEFENEENQTRADSAIFQYEYFITIPLLEGEASVYSGNVIFTVKLDSRSFWVITKWEDLKKEGFQSWSELKGTYY
jgi:hypothetical protein